jgi:hypothetical protein
MVLILLGKLAKLANWFNQLHQSSSEAGYQTERFELVLDG